MTRLALLGPPGAGKGTQGRALALALGVPHVATGDMIRDHIARRTDFGCRVEAAIAAGNFAADADILYWVSRRLAEPDARAGYILDGFPRDAAQAEAFTSTLDAVVDLEIAEDVLVARLAGRLVCPTCGTVYQTPHRPPRLPGVCDKDGTALTRRPDDDPAAVQHRMRVYRERTAPLQEYYGARGLLVRVDAQGETPAVTERILTTLTEKRLQKQVFEGILRG